MNIIFSLMLLSIHGNFSKFSKYLKYFSKYLKYFSKYLKYCASTRKGVITNMPLKVCVIFSLLFQI